jgi:hypothetical protein
MISSIRSWSQKRIPTFEVNRLKLTVVIGRESGSRVLIRVIAEPLGCATGVDGTWRMEERNTVGKLPNACLLDEKGEEVNVELSWSVWGREVRTVDSDLDGSGNELELVDCSRVAYGGIST